PLGAGLSDRLSAAGIPVFGPSAAAARIESSKIFAKQIMEQAGIPYTQAHTFADQGEGINFARASAVRWVVTADVLAAGKGVVVAETVEATVAAIRTIMS